MTREQCDARYSNGNQCRYAATHTHTVKPVGVDDVPVELHVCGHHLRMLLRRERLHSEPEVLDAWLGT